MFSVENSGAPDMCITLVEVFFTQNLLVTVSRYFLTIIFTVLCVGVLLMTGLDDDPDAQERGAS